MSELFRNIRKKLMEKPLLMNALVLALITTIILSLSVPFLISDYQKFFYQILVEAYGMIFDLAIIGILLFWLTQVLDRERHVRDLLSEIDDFRVWKSDEAAFRNMGNIKKLNRYKVTQLKLYECHLSRTNLSRANLRKSNLNHADLSKSKLQEVQLQGARLNQTNFNGSEMNSADMSGSLANGSTFVKASLVRANLSDAFLINADFSDSQLLEADLKGALLAGANFENCNLYKADLRGAKGLTPGQLSTAKNLFQTRLDPDIEAELNKLATDNTDRNNVRFQEDEFSKPNVE